MTIVIPVIISGTIIQNKVKKGHFNRLANYVFNILTAMIHPIRLHFQSVVANVVRKKIIEKNDNSLGIAFRQNSNIIKQINEGKRKHVRLQQGLETIYQLAIGTILLFLASSNTRTSQGLSALFESDSINIFGFSMSPKIVIAVNMVLNFLSFTIANINGIRSESYFPIMSKMMLAVSVLCSCAARIMSITLYFAPSLGLFDLLFHYKGKTN